MEGKNYIGGRWVEALGGARFESRNPARFDQALGAAALSNREDAEQAVASAKAVGESTPLLKTRIGFGRVTIGRPDRLT